MKRKEMKNKKRNKKILLLLVLLLSVSVGFALLSTTLKINGTASVKGNTWDIRWDDESVNVTTGSVQAEEPVVSGTNDDTVSFEANLQLPGDFYEFTVDAINQGTVDGIITDIETTIKDNVQSSEHYGEEVALPSYIHFSVTYADGVAVEEGHRLAKRVDASTPTRQAYKVRLEYDANSEEIPESDLAYLIEYKVTYGQASKDVYKYKTRQVDNTITAGDEICVGTECFYVISTNANDTVLLSKYNLSGSDYRQTDSTIGNNGHPFAPGSNQYTNRYYAYYRFENSDTDYSYWEGKVGPGLDYEGSYSGPDYPEVYDSHSVIYDVTEKYKNDMIKQGLPVTSARQLTYSEATAICGGTDCSSNTMINKSQHFYLNTAQSDHAVWTVYTSGSIGYWTNGSGGVGVRPVLVIPTSFLS